MNKCQSSDVLSSLQEHEQSIVSKSGGEDSGEWFRTLQGCRPVLLSAPHACTHERDGVVKMAEEFTAAMVMYLAGQVGCHAIFTVDKSVEDPNWVRGGEYKRALRNIVRQHDVRFLIDLHGMTNRYHMGVALGTMHGRSIANTDVVSPFSDEGFVLTAANDLPVKLSAGDVNPAARSGAAENENWRRLVVDHPRFTGGLRNHTITRYACEELGINSLQVELASVARIVYCPRTLHWPYEYSGHPDAINASVNALSALIVANS